MTGKTTFANLLQLHLGSRFCCQEKGMVTMEQNEWCFLASDLYCELHTEYNENNKVEKATLTSLGNDYEQ